MTKYLIQDTTLTSIADEIRTLSGTEETLSPEAMKEKVAEGNENIAAEADLITQIKTALERKAVEENLKIAYICYPNSTRDSYTIIFQENQSWKDYYNSRYGIQPYYYASGESLTMHNITVTEDTVAHKWNALWYITKDGTFNGRVQLDDKIIDSYSYIIYDND